MMINKKEKTFDAVKMMRKIRDQISEETQSMSFEQLKAYIKENLGNSDVKLIGKK